MQALNSLYTVLLRWELTGGAAAVGREIQGRNGLCLSEEGLLRIQVESIFVQLRRISQYDIRVSAQVRSPGCCRIYSGIALSCVEDYGFELVCT